MLSYSYWSNLEAQSPETTLHDASHLESFEGRIELFGNALKAYTSRRMTYAGDSLNAFLGMLTGFQRRLFPLGFIYGLPVLHYAVTLA